jgi:hypothetical protein
MTISKIIASASLALAIMGGAIALTPSSAEAGEQKFISYDALKKNSANLRNKGTMKPANPYTRGCSAINRCRR